MIACRPSLDPARPREVASEDAAQRRATCHAGGQSEKLNPIRRLESEHLSDRRKRVLDLGQWGRCAGGKDQLARLIVADSGELRQIERPRELQWTTELAFCPSGE